MYYSVYVGNTLLFSTNNLSETPYVEAAKLSMSDNAAGSLEMTLLPGCPVTIQRLKSRIRVQRDGTDIWEGRALSEDIDFLNRKTYHCEGALAYLLDVVQPKRTFHGTMRGFFEDVIKMHNSRVGTDKQFTVGAITVHNNESTFSIDINYENTLELITSALINSEDANMQGHLRVRLVNGTRYLDYLSDFPNTSAQTIQFAENLLDFTQNFELSELATVIIPIGTLPPREDGTSGDLEDTDDTLTIASVNSGSIYLESSSLINLYGRVEKVVDFGEVESATELKKKGQEWFSNQQFDDVSITANVLDLAYSNPNIHAFDILDRVHCVSEPHGMNRFFPVTELVINLLDAGDETITLNYSEKAGGISSSTVKTSEMIDERLKTLPSLTRILDMAKRNATEIMNMATNGWVTIVKDEKDGHAKEIIISETKDWRDSERLWKWSMNGFAYSNDGGKTWDIAITMDGSIVANFITAGVMSADRIQGGTLKLGGIGNYNGLLEVYNEDDVLIGSWSVNGINMISGSKLEKAIEINNGLLKMFRDGMVSGHFNGTYKFGHLVDGSDTPVLDGYGAKLAGRYGLLLESPLLGVSTEFHNEDENSFYSAGGTGALKAIQDIWVDSGQLKYSYKNVKFTNGLMTTDLGGVNTGTGGGAEFPVPPVTDTQQSIVDDYESFIVLPDRQHLSTSQSATYNGYAKSTTLRSITQQYFDYDFWNGEVRLVNSNRCRQTNTVNVGPVIGNIKYDSDTGRYKNGNTLLPDFPVITPLYISRYDSIPSRSVFTLLGERNPNVIIGNYHTSAKPYYRDFNGSHPGSMLVYVGYYYDSWYVIGPLCIQKLTTSNIDSPFMPLYIRDGVSGFSAVTDIITNHDVYNVVSTLFDANIYPGPYRYLSSYNIQTSAGVVWISVQLYWSSGTFMVQPGIAWATSYTTDNYISVRYNDSYFLNSARIGLETITLSPIKISTNMYFYEMETDTYHPIINKINGPLTKNQTYMFANSTSALNFIDRFKKI